MPLLICLGIDNYAHVQTVNTRPFFFGWVGPGNEAGNGCKCRNQSKAGVFGVGINWVSIYEPDTVMIARVLLISLCFSILPFLQ